MYRLAFSRAALQDKMKYLEENIYGFKDQVKQDKKYIHTTGDNLMPKKMRSKSGSDSDGT